ncbi:MDR family MFS transporter [Tumebacillus sp. DT12]|uniref:MDR family MFS transporter n=2 Tax=Tumebacillus lacus TaxID=2995335 RepID=A0ABT3X4P3_9BACL|nr:MDR family MFS transporter [Tumebacillus lacus]
MMAVLLIGTFIAILNQTLLNIALPKIIEDLGISTNTAQWLITIYLLINGVMIPITAFLIERYSTRQLFLTSIGIFAVGSLICALSTNFTGLLIGRIVQSMGAGVMMPLMQTVILLIFPREKRGAAMGMVGLAIAFAPAIGPTLSGWIVEHYSWRLLFYVVLPITLLDLLFAAVALKNVGKLTYPKLDPVSIITSTIGFSSLLYGFSSAGSQGWGATEVLATLVIGAISLILFVWRQLNMERPMLEIRVLKYGIFTLATGIATIVFIAMMGINLLLPLYLQQMRGVSALDSGLMLLPGAILMGIMNPITGRIFDKVGARWLAVIGMAIVTVSTFQLTSLTITTSYLSIIITYSFCLIGVSMVMMPITTAGINQLPPQLIAHGSAMTNTLRTVGGSIGTAILVTVMTITADNAPIQVKTDAMIHGINNAYLVASLLALAGMLLSFFLKKPQPMLDVQPKH